MTLKDIYEWDKRNLERIKKFQLASRYKKVGIGMSCAAVITLITLKFTNSEPSWLHPLLKNFLLLGMLVVSISKEEIEDEYIVMLRSQSYRMAFLLGVVYVFVQPYVTYGVELLLKSEEASMDMTYFQVLVFMLLIQLLFFHVLLKKCHT
ncbi:hypothetical protein [Altibacter sp.]|uniref:hypothetical protein n=1 Tax=Altibacter sp. TaxID=2024823 RepID=UPI000C931D9D|nr:hypothetical protein [Altibacter sp.]MAP54418.1 hypothetical protein [Altibacter sp.]